MSGEIESPSRGWGRRIRTLTVSTKNSRPTVRRYPKMTKAGQSFCSAGLGLIYVALALDHLHLIPAEPFMFWLKAILQPLGERAHDRISLTI